MFLPLGPWRIFKTKKTKRRRPQIRFDTNTTESQVTTSIGVQMITNSGGRGGGWMYVDYYNTDKRGKKFIYCHLLLNYYGKSSFSKIIHNQHIVAEITSRKSESNEIGWLTIMYNSFFDLMRALCLLSALLILADYKVVPSCYA